MSSTRSPICKARLGRVLALWAAILGLGLCYGGLISALGWGIPCVFHLLTGLKCPGCGVSHMALCLLRGDVSGAFDANGGVLCLLPLGFILALDQSVRYVRSGTRRLGRLENGLVIFMIVFLVMFGVLRNLPFPA